MNTLSLIGSLQSVFTVCKDNEALNQFDNTDRIDYFCSELFYTHSK